MNELVEAAARAICDGRSDYWPDDGDRECAMLDTQAALTAAKVPELLEAATTFKAKHERFHPDHWIAGGKLIDGRTQYCDACDFCAALASLDLP